MSNYEFHLKLLGTPEIRRDGALLTGFESRKALALLCYLVAKRQAASRIQLATLFWGDKTETRGRGNLSRVLHNITSLVPGVLDGDRHTVWFVHSPAHWIDIDVFDNYAAKGDVNSLTAATELYRDEFMAGLYLDGCPEFETWLVTEQEWWRQRVVQLLRDVIVRHTERGEYQLALHLASRLLALDPWREEAHRYMMLLLALSGQRTAALMQYEKCKRILAEELGVEPTEETTALYQQLLTTDRDEQLLPPVTTFVLPVVGRQEERAWLIRQWNAAQHGQASMTLVAGEAGLGKTTLIEEVMQYVIRSGYVVLKGRCHAFGTPIAYQSIAAALRSGIVNANTRVLSANIRQPIGEVWLTELARLLPDVRELYPDLPEPQVMSGDAARQRLFEAVARFLQTLSSDGPVAVFLDDLHWAEQATVDLLRFLIYRLEGERIWFLGSYRREEMAPGTAFNVLLHNLMWEHKVALLNLNPLQREAIDEVVNTLSDLDDAHAELFAAYLAQTSAGNPFMLDHIVRDLEGRSILRWAGGKWRVDVDQLVEQTAKNVSQRDSVPTGMQQLILDRVARLPTAARDLLHQAATIGRSFDPRLLQIMAGPDGEPTVIAAIQEWVDRHLVSFQPPSTYEFVHEMIHEVVYDSVPIWYRRQLHARVAEALKVLYSEDDAQIVEQLAYHYKESGNDDRALRYWLRAAEHAEETYAWGLVVRYYSQALTLLADGHVEARYNIVVRHERACHKAALREAQEADLIELETLASTLDDPVRLVDVYCRRAEWAFSTGRFTTGIYLAREAVQRARDCGRPELAAESLRYGALCLSNVGDYSEANEWAAKAHELYVEADDRRGQALALNILGVVTLGQGFIDKAQAYLEDTITEWRRMDDVRQLAMTLSTVSTLYQRKGDYHQALEIQLEARDLVSQVGDPLLDANSITSLGRIYHALGRYDEALEAYGKALKLGHAAAAPKLQAAALLSRAHTYFAFGDVAKAKAGYHESLATQKDIGAVLLRSETLTGLADCYLARGEFQSALDVLAQAKADVKDRERSGISEILVRQAEAYAGLGELNTALGIANRAVTVLREPETYVTDIASIWRVAHVLKRCDDAENAQLLLNLADELMTRQADMLSDPVLRDGFLEAAETRRRNLTAMLMEVVQLP